MPDHPVGVDLGCTLGVQRNHLESAEVSLTDGEVLRAHVVDVQNIILVKIVFAHIPTSIAWEKDMDMEVRNMETIEKELQN